MDCSSVASEIPDLLENLYKYPLSISSETSCHRRGNDACVPFQRYYNLQTSKKSTTRSNSLVLKETTESSFNVEQNPSTELKYQAYHIFEPKASQRINLNKSPKPPQKKLKKRSQATRKIHSTVSNQENSLYLVVSRQESDKVYEIKTSVTGSATLLKIKADTYSLKSNENVTLQDSLKSNKILDSVRMERKRREEKLKNGEEADGLKAGNRFVANTITGTQFGQETTVCHCPFVSRSPKKCGKIKNLKPNDDSSKSRVRISGRLGLTEDDKYVLKCAATINDQPFETHCIETKRQDSPVNIFFNQHPNQTSDAHTEARTELANKNEATYNICRKGSASTQVNLNLFFSGGQTDQKDETVQCCCGYTKEISTYTEDDAITEAEMKNPLVVISVFKTRGGQDKSDFDIKVGEAGDVTIVENKPRNNELPQKKTPTQPEKLDNSERVLNKNTRKLYDKNIKPRLPTPARTASPLRPAGFRSPTSPKNDRSSPGRSPLYPRIEKKYPVKGTISPSSNPVPAKINQTPTKPKFEPSTERKKPAPRTDSSPERNNFFNKTDAISDRNKLMKRTDTSPERSKSTKGITHLMPMTPKELDRKGSPYTSFGARQTLQRTITERNKPKLTFQMENNIISPRRSAVTQYKSDQAKNINLEIAKAKKSLVDSFTRKMTEKIIPKGTVTPEKHQDMTNSLANSSGSRVTVNIDAENEFYDLLFQQDSDTTDLSIRKRRKFRGSPKQSLEYHHENLSASLENFLVSSENNERKRSVSQTWNNYDNVALTPPPDKPTPPLKFIDSIELSHRREERSNTNHSIKLTQTNFDNTKEASTTTKHYRGDKCPIMDPMQREMEIRELLGVQKRKLSPTSTVNSKVETISKLSHIDTLRIYCPQENRKISVMVLLNQNSNIKTKIGRSEDRGTSCAEPKTMSTQCGFETNTDKEVQLESFHISENAISHKSKSISLCKVDYYKVRKLIQRALTQKNTHRICKRAGLILPREIQKKKVSIVEKSTQTAQIGDCPKELKNNDKSKQTKTKGFLLHENTHTEGGLNEKLYDDIRKRETINIVRKESKKMIVLFSAKQAKRLKENEHLRKPRLPMQTLSAVEIRYANVAHKFTAALTSNKHAKKNLCTSNETCVQETRRPISPNLGFSALSLCGEPGSVTSLKKPPASSPRKPLLRRLVSCLVLKSQKVANVKKERSTPRMVTVKNSVDWYRVTSSCAPFEMSSSVYDTSASFYTDHEAEPIKSRKGFLSSVWSMLTS